MPSQRVPKTTGIASVDSLAANATPTLADYLASVSEYIRLSPQLNLSVKKTAQIALSAGLARCLKHELEARVPGLHAHAGERNVAGALRNVQADVSESHEMDGLRLAVEIKPVNLAVGRAVWNRFGDIRAFAVNIHLKFPFAVVGGILTVPTWEWGDSGQKLPTANVIGRLVKRLSRTRLRLSEADPPHLLEAIAVVIYDPETGAIDPVSTAARLSSSLGRVRDDARRGFDLRFE